MNVETYLNRIGYKGSIAPTFECLRRVHRHHALSISYENIDVQLGTRLDNDIERIFDKLVTRKRGGWCYEMNGLLGWALANIGFDVMRVAAGILRTERGDVALGNHLILLVRLDRIYVGDLGMGDGLREPIPLDAGTYVQGSLHFRLERIDSTYWRFHSHSFGYPPNYDFEVRPADEGLLQAKGHSLQEIPELVFVQNLICQLMQADSVTCLTGRVLREKHKNGGSKTILDTPADLTRTLDNVFGIRDINVAPIWPKILARHELLFGGKTVDQIDVKGM